MPECSTSEISRVAPSLSQSCKRFEKGSGSELTVRLRQVESDLKQLRNQFARFQTFRTTKNSKGKE
ncbi:hypothetical protein KIN20_026427 [Parelaphostrongylus tenuis]|uniref:Uncharacterized protein n=1 Tax=Parelaphostrongylus tenuis TaxID=148309 RepID=A0AAD5QY07_PARTN|nr:hypothetical protein KIN20_026427 [Parelaphostrongylus tenuis]